MSGTETQILTFVGAVIMYTIEYLDLGKWVAAIEGGAHFGGYCAPIIGLVTCLAMTCQYIANHIVVITGKNLVKICGEEYSKLTCMILGVVIELSIIISDLIMTLSIAHGLKLSLGLGAFDCVISSAIVPFTIPFFQTLPRYSNRMIYAIVSIFTLLFYVRGILINQSEIPHIIPAKDPEFNLELLCSVAVLLGSHIMPQNIYIHSSVAEQMKLAKVTTDTGIEYKVSVMLPFFSLICLANYTLMRSAVAVFDNANHLMPTFQEAFMSMDQILGGPSSVSIFTVVFIISSLLKTTSRTAGRKVLLNDFFCADHPIWIHHFILQSLSTIPALYCLHCIGSEEIYLLLLFCQVLLATLLPPSLIPLLRVSSSQSLMGSSKSMTLIRVLLWFPFIGMVATNAILIVAMLLGKGCWIAELSGLPYTILLLFGLMSFGFTIYLAYELLLPVSSVQDEKIYPLMLLEKEQDDVFSSEEKLWIETMDNCVQELGKLEDTDKALDTEPDGSFVLLNLDRHSSVVSTEYEVNMQDMFLGKERGEVFSTEEKPSVKTSKDNSGQEVGKQEAISDVLGTEPNGSLALLNLDHHGSFSICECEDNMGNMILAHDQSPISELFCPEKMPDFTGDLCAEGFTDGAVIRDVESAVSIQDGEELKVAIHDKKDDSIDSRSSSATFEELGTNDVGVKCDNTDAGSMNSVQIGLGRSGRRQFAAILDEFWGNLFDLHGNLTEKGKIIRADLLFGLNIEVSSSSIKDDKVRSGACNFSDETTTNLGASSLFTINTTVGYQQGNCTLPAVSELRKAIMKSFLNEKAGQLNDEKVSSLAKMANEQAHNASNLGPRYEDFDGFAQSLGTIRNSTPCWAPLQWEGMFTTTTILAQKCPASQVAKKAFPSKVFFSYNESKGLLLNSLRVSIRKLLNLEGSDWLFGQKGWYDEKLIDLVAALEIFRHGEANGKFIRMVNTDEELTNLCSSILGCGDACTWQAGLIISFGVWCVFRIFDLLISEKRPELWGKYTYVLNRLQGILDPAFLDPREPVPICLCVEDLDPSMKLFESSWPDGSRCTGVNAVLNKLKDVEAAIYRRKGRAGTAAGDIAYTKGKENVASVLKRYKRRFSKMPSMVR